jgi:hypothetical protein
MTTTADYLALLPAASARQPNFSAFLSALLDGLVDGQNVMLAMPDAFDLDKAVGAQLDAIGERVGLSRKLPVPLTGVYFALDTDGVGLDQGVLRGPFDPAEALTTLDDGTYRLVLRLKIKSNAWDGSFASAQAMLGALTDTSAAPPPIPTTVSIDVVNGLYSASVYDPNVAPAQNRTLIFMQDRFDMSCDVCVSGIIPSRLFVSLLRQMKEWIRPAGVALANVYVTSASGSPLFGLDVNNANVAGLDFGAVSQQY